MPFRVVWRDELGEQGSTVIDEFAGARLIADALSSCLAIVHIIDATTSKSVYSRRHKRETTLHPVVRRSIPGIAR